jgi:hypothetical protein
MAQKYLFIAKMRAKISCVNRALQGLGSTNNITIGSLCDLMECAQLAKRSLGSEMCLRKVSRMSLMDLCELDLMRNTNGTMSADIFKRKMVHTIQLKLTFLSLK